MTILIIEDEEKLCSILSRGLKAEGYSVDLAMDGLRGLEMATTYSYDLILLDIHLPNMNGTQVLERIRERDRHTPVIMLTAKDTIADKVTHFENGADDYLTKPFSFAELLVRIKALLRRGAVQHENTIKISDLEINRLSRLVKRGGKRIELSTKEYALLEYLAQNKERVMSRTMIVEHVWDQSFEGLTNIVDVYVRQLRAKLDEEHPQKLIHTVRGIGYMLRMDETP